MDFKKLLDKLDLIEDTMRKSAKNPTGPKYTGQWRGTDAGTPGKKLVGDSIEPEENILKDLSKGPTPKTREQELAEQFDQFLQQLEEENLGVEDKRPQRKGSRPQRKYTKDGQTSDRYTSVKQHDEVDEGKVVPVITAFRKGMEKIAASDMNPQAKQAAFDKLSAEFHKNAQAYSDAVKAKRKVTEVGTPVATGQSTMADKTGAAAPVDPKQMQATTQAVSAIKTATGSSVPAQTLVKAIGTASQGAAIDAKTATALQPMMQDVATIAQNPKLANQLKTVLSQAQQQQVQQQKQQQQQQQPKV